MAEDEICCPIGSTLLPEEERIYDYFKIDKFVESLSNNKTLIGRPKILIFDCCRGIELNFGQLKSFGMEVSICSLNIDALEHLD